MDSDGMIVSNLIMDGLSTEVIPNAHNYFLVSQFIFRYGTFGKIQKPIRTYVCTTKFIV